MLTPFREEEGNAATTLNAGEVVRTALRILERDEPEFNAKLTALRAAINERDASGVGSKGNSFDRIHSAKAFEMPMLAV